MTPYLPPLAIACNRFGLGIRPQENLALNTRESATQWLEAQFSLYHPVSDAWRNQEETSVLLTRLFNIGKNSENQRQNNTPSDSPVKSLEKQQLHEETKKQYQQAVMARTWSAVQSNTPFAERLVHFWANHFAVSADNPRTSELIGAYELEAIRPNIMGNFSDLLLAVARHPAMLIYLDQAKSIGPNSMAGQRFAERNPDKKRGLNENLAREILELHTLGVHGGYTQMDVTEFARALTGWSVQENAEAPQKNMAHASRWLGKYGFAFYPALHEPGTRTLLGNFYPQTDRLQAEAILKAIALHPATAKHLAFKLARHFVSDQPPADLVESLANVYLTHQGDLQAVYRALINADIVWQTPANKFKTPWEWLISAMRGLNMQFNIQTQDKFNIPNLMNALGQAVWKPGAPAGYDDIADTWAAPNALLRRVELAQRIVNRLPDQPDARQLASLLLPTLGETSKNAIQHAESNATGLALLLVCPEFLRR